MTTPATDPVPDPAGSPASAVLDNPAYAALTGPQAHLAQVRGRALRYLPGVARFAGLPADPTGDDWADLAAMVGHADAVAMLDAPVVPRGWTVTREFEAVQMVQMVRAGGPGPAEHTVPRVERDSPAAERDSPAAEQDSRDVGGSLRLVELSAPDVPEMLDLVARTEPGPFGPRTIELGRYVGVRDGGVLVAMAGERMRAPGWTEVSAVCTDAAYRGRGLGGRLVDAVSEGIVARGDAAFLQVMSSNTGARAVYAARGFSVRRELTIRVLQPPV